MMEDGGEYARKVMIVLGGDVEDGDLEDVDVLLQYEMGKSVQLPILGSEPFSGRSVVDVMVPGEQQVVI